MCSDIDQGTATLLILVQEHAPCRHCTAADRVCFCEIDLAQLACFTFLFQILAVGTIAALIPDGQDLSRLFRSVQHFLSFGTVDRHGLFAHDILAGVQRIHCNK